MTEDSQPDTAVGVIGGSGLYELEGLTDIKEIAVETPAHALCNGSWSYLEPF